MPTYNIPYQLAFGARRPYLALHVTGLTGNSGNIIGLVDSGADATTLPLGFSRLMGFTSNDLEASSARQADGSSMPIFNAKRAVSAHIVGLKEPAFELWPSFSPSSQLPLWGRRDVFLAFGFTFDERGQMLLLHVP